MKTVVADNLSGLLVNGHDARTWAEALSQIALNEELANRLQIGARQHASKFSWDKTVDGLVAVYEKAISTPTKTIRNLKVI